MISGGAGDLNEGSSHRGEGLYNENTYFRFPLGEAETTMEGTEIEEIRADILRRHSLLFVATADGDDPHDDRDSRAARRERVARYGRLVLRFDDENIFAQLSEPRSSR